MEFPTELIEKLKSAKSVLFFTGAGISAESGIDTFRGKNGLWNKMKPQELASFDGFMSNPNLVWEWYQYRRKILKGTGPNPGHLAIAEFEKYIDKVTVVTQNVDNLHFRAGSSNILELHGNIERNYCIDCKTYYGMDDFLDVDEAPKCPKCGGMIRPDVVWFGENLPQNIFAEAEKIAKESDICFVVGTSAVVFPAAYIPISAKEGGSYVVEINIEPTEITNSVDYSLTGKSGEILPELLKQLKE
ncbi:NAD-dependent protein deacetylase of SIR2 family [hydrothermal vent metagenome]|uniref:NAD-dependent protein deacetylase of SIR2 family n=1 Tax=hydrothermal vent metagenome TaxID=652676 RepID=A0A3B1C448_9ZZZZ